MEILREENKRKGLLGTILFHALIILLLMISGFSMENEVDEMEGAVEVSIGEPDRGGPDFEPATTAPAVSTPTPPSSEQSQELTQNNDDAPEVMEKPKPTKPTPKPPTPETTTKPNPQPDPTPQRTVDQTSLFKKKTGSQGQGDGDKPGNQGDPDGSENGNPKGTGKGTGTGQGKTGSGDYSLNGRTAVYRHKPDCDQQTSGTIVVIVSVDKEGKVVKAEAKGRGTTVTNTDLKRCSEIEAMKWRFDPRKDGSGLQEGTITFVYKLN